MSDEELWKMMGWDKIDKENRKKEQGVLIDRKDKHPDYYGNKRRSKRLKKQEAEHKKVRQGLYGRDKKMNKKGVYVD